MSQSEEDERIIALYEQGGDADLEYLAYEDYLAVRLDMEVRT